MQNNEVDLVSVQVRADREGFVLECLDQEQRTVQLQFRSWALHQLMRALPRVDAAMHQTPGSPASAVHAHPVTEWFVQRSGIADDVAMCLRTDRQVESAFTLDYETALAFHRELGEAIARAASSAPPNGGPWPAASSH